MWQLRAAVAAQHAALLSPPSPTQGPVSAPPPPRWRSAIAKEQEAVRVLKFATRISRSHDRSGDVTLDANIEGNGALVVAQWCKVKLVPPGAAILSVVEEAHRGAAILSKGLSNLCNFAF